MFRRSVATMLSERSRKNNTAGAWTLVSAYTAGILNTVGGRVSKECNFQARSNIVPKSAQVRAGPPLTN